ncbi:glycoside hydrolase family 43 protein [Labilibaculum sp. DW002]|uniref:Glycoside hydrolase family 43 protein n=1 Tax=Paralabilibaculum antarcticum TaxID=2912572 RepID=A0ABT5VT96_9BACT|nr:glycoside hydrolase family 43 protein [Labilibaculum sp. DW002]MDE5418516.1 glycoside hydrolase family 43 protein [Labilibaculum sp. DW002]
MLRNLVNTSTLLFFVFVLLACTPNGEVQNKARFYSFSYQGKDSFYKDNPLASNEFYNPILPGFYPDPSICKKGDDFYLVNSSFSFFPGIPVFHSTNLTDWEQLGHVLDRPSQLNLDGLAISEGVFAPAITYNKFNDTFYVIGTVVQGSWNFIVKAKDPAGPWSEPIYLPQIEQIDPSLFIDEDGKAYIVHNSEPDGEALYDGHRTIRMWEYDLATDKVIGEGKVIVNGGSDISKEPIWIEGPHLYKINEYYYLMCAEGGTAEDHSEVIFRSKEVNGPYIPFKNNPILSQRQLDSEREYPVTCTGHADIIQDNKGDWWGVFLGCRPYGDNYFNTGRETFLLPVSWKDGWPVFLESDKAVGLIQEKTGLVSTIDSTAIVSNGNFSKTDNFDSEELAMNWNFIRTPNEKWYQLNSDEKYLEIDAIATNSREIGNPAFIGRRQQHANFEVEVEMTFEPKQDKEAAGLLCFQNESHHFFFGKRQEDGKTFLQLEKALPSDKGPISELLERIELQSDGILKLKIEGKGKYYSFYYSIDSENWILLADNINASLLSTKVAGGFVGSYIGMYASSNH